MEILGKIRVTLRQMNLHIQKGIYLAHFMERLTRGEPRLGGLIGRLSTMEPTILPAVTYLYRMEIIWRREAGYAAASFLWGLYWFILSIL